MQQNRRQLIVTIFSVFGAAFTSFPALTLHAQANPQPMASPNAPANQNVPAGLDGANIPVNNAGAPLPAATWLEIKSDAQKLLDITTDFKAKIDHTNLSSTLPLPLIEEAHRIEKLAKHIQDRMKH